MLRVFAVLARAFAPCLLELIERPERLPRIEKTLIFRSKMASKKQFPTGFNKELMRVAEEGFASEIKSLIEDNGADPHAQDLNGKTAFLYAASSGHLDCLKALAPVSYLKKIDDTGDTALIAAAQNGHLDCVAFLSGVINPESMNNRGATALSEAADRGHLDCVEFLASVSSVNAMDNRQETALMRAAQAGHSDCVRFLLPLSDPAALAWYESTALMLVVRSVNWNAVSAQAKDSVFDCLSLLIPVSDLNARDDEGKTALEMAVSLRRWRCVDALARPEDQELMAVVEKEFGSKFAQEFPRWGATMEAEQLAQVAGLAKKAAEGEGHTLNRDTALRKNRL